MLFLNGHIAYTIKRATHDTTPQYDYVRYDKIGRQMTILYRVCAQPTELNCIGSQFETFNCSSKIVPISVKMSKYSQQFLTEFFEIYRSFTCLWKVKAPEYHDRVARKRAMCTLVAKFKEVEPSATEEFVKKKINNYRTSYKRERNLVEASLKSGAGTEDVYIPKLWYYKLLLFLDDQCLPRASTSNISDDNEVGSTFNSF